jgi:RNA polymerase sigma-70 factor (ECF subfamily)
MKRTGKEKEQEFSQAYEDLSDILFRHCYFRVSNREVALDIVQEGFTKTWLHITRGDDIVNLKAFLYQVMNNLIIDHYRKRKSSSLDLLQDDGFDPASREHEDILIHAEHSQVEEILKLIPEKDRVVIVMRYIDGLSVQEIARTLKEPENTISVRLHRALSKVRTIFNP